MKKQNKTSLVKKGIVISLFVFLFLGIAFFIVKNISFQNLFGKVTEKDVWVRRIYLVDKQYESFKKQVIRQSNGKIAFCDIPPEVKKPAQKDSLNLDSLGSDIDMRLDRISGLSSLGPDSAIVKFSYCKNENKSSQFNLKFAHAIVAFDSSDKYKIVKVTGEQSFVFSSSWDYGEWLKLEKKYGVERYPSRHFTRSLMRFMEFKVVKKLNNGWSEIYFNPFLLGLNEEKPYHDNDIYFGLYKSKPVLFFTNEYLRFKLKLKQNQGMATDFEGNEHFIYFKDVTNQIFLHSISEPNLYIDTKIRSVSDTEYHFSAPLIQIDNGNYFIISEEVTIDFSDQREIDFKAIWINSQPEMTDKIINDYKQYLIDKPKLNELVSLRPRG